MNTVFFQKAVDTGRYFGWKDIFSDVLKHHRKDQLGSLLSKGTGGNIHAPNKMLQEWQKPWLFSRVALAGIAFSIAIAISLMIFPASGMYAAAFMIPAFSIPLSVLIFYWEMNIPGNISLFEALILILIGGILSLTVTGIVRILFQNASDVAMLLGPFPEELAKAMIVCLLLCRKKYNYGLQGILVGGAVGVGFSAIESAGYAFNSLLQGSGIFGITILRGLLSIGGHVVWAALYGGALALAKGKNKMSAKCLIDPLFLMTWSGAFLLHTAWNFSIVNLAGILPESVLVFFYKVEVGMITQYIRPIVLIILGWMFLLYVMKKSIRQIVCVNEMYKKASSEKHNVSKKLESTIKQDPNKVIKIQGVTGFHKDRIFSVPINGRIIFGRNAQSAVIRYPEGTRGISNIHCEITWENGVPVLRDLNSTYGTFFEDGRKLKPNVPYKIENNTVFYLVNTSSMFLINIL